MACDDGELFHLEAKETNSPLYVQRGDKMDVLSKKKKNQLTLQEFVT